MVMVIYLLAYGEGPQNYGRKEGNILFNDTLTTFFLRLYDIGHIVKHHSETCCHKMDHTFWLAARVLLNVPSHRQDSTYHGLYYTSRGTLARMRNRSMGPPWGIDLIIHHTMSRHSTMELHFASRVMKPFCLLFNCRNYWWKSYLL